MIDLFLHYKDITLRLIVLGPHIYLASLIKITVESAGDV